MNTRRLNLYVLKDVDSTDRGAAGTVWTRWEIYSSHDPYLAFLTQETRWSIANAVVPAISHLDDEGLGSHLITTSWESMHPAVMAVLNDSPLAALLTIRFKNYIADTFCRVAFPQTFTR